MRKKAADKIVYLALTFCLVLGMSFGAFAASAVTLADGRPAPDATRVGSVELTMKSGGTAVPGGTFEIYKVADLKTTDEGDPYYEISDSFKECISNVDDIFSGDYTVTRTLASYAENKLTALYSVDVGNSGVVKFSNLSMGVYLFLQTKAADGYKAVNPFLMSIPVWDEEANVWVYDIQAYPKPEIVKETESETTPTTTETPTKPNLPKTPGSSTPGTPTGDTTTVSKLKLPQTGQLNWPIPVMGISGLMLIIIGHVVRPRRNDA